MRLALVSLRGGAAVLAPSLAALNFQVPFFGIPASSSAGALLGRPDSFVSRLNPLYTWNPADAQKGPAPALGLWNIDPTGFGLEPIVIMQFVRVGPRYGIAGMVLPE